VRVGSVAPGTMSIASVDSSSPSRLNQKIR